MTAPCTTNNQSTTQWLVSFCNKTLVVNLSTPLTNDDPSLEDALLQQISNRTGWPLSRLLLRSIAAPWASVRVQSQLVGGKGGFGTLLRSSARQSGAKLTTDFGACRDLQGRRLRHVNDEIKLRKWREAQERSNGKDDAVTDALFDTPSGLYGWYCLVPSWADVSKKATRKIQRQFRRMQAEEDKIEREKQEQKAQYERGVQIYVQRTTEAAQAVKTNMMSAVKQGLQAQAKKRKREEVPPLAEGLDRPNSLCTLSGEVVVEETQKKIVQIQSQSDFSTLALFLDKPLEPTDASTTTILYYEVRLVTGGLAQIGWADMTSEEFKPNTEEGEGVGDDKGSYGYDGSRGLKFHNGEETVYKNSPWKAGDVVGCHYNLQNGEMSYSLNGTDLGVAFTMSNPGTILFPALSCNGGEILELHLGAKEMEHLSKGGKKKRVFPVRELIAASIIDDSNADGEPDDQKPPAKTAATETKKDSEKPAVVEEKPPEEKKEPETTKEPEKKKEPVKVEALDLSEYQSASDLEELGLDRLKGALMAFQVKCGGSLKERAERLFSLKGVDRKDYPKKVRAKNFVI